MFGALTEKFQNLFSSLAGKKKFTEENIADAVREVRLALLDADVNYSVASQFIKRVKEKAVGEEVLKAVSPHEQFVKIVHDELVSLMGSEEKPLDLKGSPSVILLCGLQGSGKTTQCAKLAAFLKKQKVLIAACDLQRPAAIEQIKTLGKTIDVPVFGVDGESNPLVVAKKALEKAKSENFDVLIVDTAGRLHIDEELMEQLKNMKDLLQPHEVLFVASANTGQDAVKTAQEFDQKIGITGSILTMLDGSARAGAAISIREVTQKPLMFEGIGEKIGDLQLFNPRSMADRILGMGDIINLVRKAEEHIDQKEKEKLEEKFRKASFTYEDFLKQMSMMKKMGSMKSLLKMLPGMPDMGDLEYSEKEFKNLEAMILSMTPDERTETVELAHPRRKRIAAGSGTHVDEVNKMVKNFKRLKQFAKDMPNLKKQFSKFKGDMNLWR